MTNRDLVMKLIGIGVEAWKKNPADFADPSRDAELGSIGVAGIAGWLEELGKLRLIGKVEPRFGTGMGTLVYQLTDEAITLVSAKFVVHAAFLMGSNRIGTAF